MPPIPVKKTKKLAQAEAEGRVAGEVKANRKIKLEERIKEKILQSIGETDPLEALAIFSTTVIVHNVMMDIPEAVDKLKSNPWKFLAPTIAFPFVFESIGGVFEIFSGPTEEKPPPEFADEVKAWIVSYGIAFVIVRHGDEIFKAITSIPGIVRSFMGIPEVAAVG